jgi:DNA-binding XRE family transcriptional regulator
MHHKTYVRHNRKLWSLSQKDLSDLLGISQTAVSRLESGDSPPDIKVALALQVVFGKCPHDIFVDLYRAVEDEVMRAAAEMDRWVAGKTDRKSMHKQQLLESMVIRSGGSSEPL